MFILKICWQNWIVSHSLFATSNDYHSCMLYVFYQRLISWIGNLVDDEVEPYRGLPHRANFRVCQKHTHTHNLSVAHPNWFSICYIFV